LCVAGCEIPNSELDDTLSRGEFDTGVRSLKSNRSTGPDNISPEFIKCGGPALLQWIFILMKRIWTFSQCDLPTTDRLDSLLPIPKKAGGTKVSWFRLICLLVSIYKVCYFSVPEGTIAERAIEFKTPVYCLLA